MWGKARGALESCGRTAGGFWREGKRTTPAVSELSRLSAAPSVGDGGRS